MSIEFQFVSGPPQAQHSPRTEKYFTKTCVRGPRNIFNENIRKQEFGLSKISTSPSEHIPSKTELKIPVTTIVAIMAILKMAKIPSMCPRTAKYFLTKIHEDLEIFFNKNTRKQEFGLSKTSTSPSEHIPSKTELSLSPCQCVHRVPIYKRPAAGAT